MPLSKASHSSNRLYHLRILYAFILNRERDAGPDGGEKRLGFYNSPASGPHAAHLQTFDKRGEDFSSEEERWGTGERKRRKENRISSTIISKRVPYLSFHGKNTKKQ